MLFKRNLKKSFLYIYSLGFSRNNCYTPDKSKIEMLYQFFYPISVKYNSRVNLFLITVKKKRELFLG